MRWVAQWQRRSSGQEQGDESSAPVAEVLSDFERDAIWAAHGRWAMDHIQHRLEMAGQLAVGAIGIQGVLLTLVAANFDEESDIWSMRFNALAMIGLVAATALVLFGAFPRKVAGINPAEYRTGWLREVTSNRWESPEQQFAEELLQTERESESPLVTAEALVERRMTWIRYGLLVSGAAVLSLAVGTLWPVMGRLL